MEHGLRALPAEGGDVGKRSGGATWMAVLVGVVIVYLLFGAHARTAYLTTLLLLELPTPDVDGPIATRLPAPLVEVVTFESAGKEIVADIFMPPGAGPHPGIVLNHGVSARGRNDVRLINFADALARCGYIALVPEFVNLKEFRVRPTDVDRSSARTSILSGVRTSTPSVSGSSDSATPEGWPCWRRTTPR